MLAERVLAGVDAWRAGAAPMLLMTGRYEAELMKRRAVKLGVPAERVLVETAALTTRENATGCAAIMRAHGMARALVVTQSFHRARAVAAFRRAGVEAEAWRFRTADAAGMRVREVVALRRLSRARLDLIECEHAIGATQRRRRGRAGRCRGWARGRSVAMASGLVVSSGPRVSARDKTTPATAACARAPPRA